MNAPDLHLSDVEARVLGALIEKDITTPDYYPMSLNGLVNACNQKNNRDPVMSLEEGIVRDALASLHDQRLAGPAGGADSRVTKYEHRLQEVFNFEVKNEEWFRSGKLQPPPRKRARPSFPAAGPKCVPTPARGCPARTARSGMSMAGGFALHPALHT